MTTSALDGQLPRLTVPKRPTALRNCSLLELGSELLSRIQEGDFRASAEAILLGCEIDEALRTSLDVFDNRTSRRHYFDMFSNLCAWEESIHTVLKGATVVELGCGSINPFGLLFLFLMVGAERAFAFDLDEIQNVPRATKALADIAAMVLVDPRDLFGNFPVSRSDILRNISSFDLARLRSGDPAGLDSKRLAFRRDSVHALSLANNEADIVFSAAFFEHITSVDAAILEIARTTRKGGIGIHIIDGSDHRRYLDPACHAIEFLTETTDAEIVYGSNRIRPMNFAQLFERHGFEVISITPFETVDVPAGLRKRLSGPFRDLPDEVLSAIGVKLVTRRVGS